MANKCNQCGKFLSTTDGAKCNKCNSVFHRLCVNVSPDSRLPARWTCPGCRRTENKNKSVVNTESPSMGDIFTDASSADNEEKNSAVCLAEEMRLLRLELMSVTREITSFRVELTRMNDNMAEFNKRVDNVEERLTSLEEKNSGSVDQNLNNVIAQLKSDINDREQKSLINDIQITGLPERSGENAVHLTLAVTKKLGLALDSCDIVSAERAGPHRALLSSEERQRPRPVIVRLARRSLRDDIIKAARVRRGTDTSGVTDGDPSRVYINEHLTRFNRLLFYKAREEGKRHGWRFIWTREGRIYMRRETDTAVQRIRTECDISKIFGLK
ncbi:uncharacterized protein LOC124532483 [Vanessa cardui]|uniref:uncharacterized protein LOC124532483 n=1 Tax=Vanessa cardui TaxID=171605 RepID=UPI001F13A106|nr:uncharacterized protein LOC124532483 [Vanessa cardui]